MSGIEAVEAIQLIDACIGIVNTIISIGRAVRDAQGLPPKLKSLFERIPAIEELLESAHESFQDGKAGPHAGKTAQPILKQCEGALNELQEVFRTACPKDDDNRGQRLWRGARTVFFGRDSRVQTLLVQIQEDLKLLEQKQIYAIADRMDDLQELTESLGREDGGQYVNTGPGNVFANEAGNPTYNVASGSHSRLVVSHGTYVENSATHTYNYLQPERPETPPGPLSNVPFRSDPQYLDRPSLSKDLASRLSAPAARVALVGLGGGGKSQLAIEFARRLRQDSPSTWVIWIHASSAARFDQSIRDVADQFRIQGRREPKADHLRLVRNWLRDERKGQWLLILDSVDNGDFLFDTPAAPGGSQPAGKRIDCIPTCEHGSVLITTRDKKQALRLLYESDVITVPPMNKDEATRLFESKLGHSDADTAQLVDALDSIPLAITQAAAYIRERRPRCSVQRYLRQIEDTRGSRRNPLRQANPLPSRDAEAVNSVLLTWHISFEHLHRTRRSAAELLSLMSFCERHDIPEILLRADTRNDVDELDIKVDFEDDIVALRNFSFISPLAHGESFEMHGLVQQAMQIWLEDQKRLDEVRDRFVHCLFSTVPTGQFENWHTCRRLYSHAKAAHEQRPIEQQALLEWATVMYNSAWYAVEQGMWTDALYMSQASLAVLIQRLGRGHESSSWSSAMVALAFRNLGEWTEAEALELEVLKLRQRTLGREHPDTLTAMSNLASTLDALGRWKDAENLKTEVLGARARGAESADGTSEVLTSMANLAATNWNQGRWAEVEDLEIRILEARATALGSGHPDAVMSAANLASTYWSLGRSEEAATLEEEVLRSRRRILGPEHVDTLTAMNNLSATYWSLARCSKAEALYAQVLAMRRKTLGDRHPDTLGSMNNLASTLQDRPEEAETLLREVVQKRQEVLGPRHPATLGSMADLAQICERLEGWGEAEELLVDVTRGWREVNGEECRWAVEAREALNRLRSKRPREVVLEILTAEDEQEAVAPSKTSVVSTIGRTKIVPSWSDMLKNVKSRVRAA